MYGTLGIQQGIILQISTAHLITPHTLLPLEKAYRTVEVLAECTPTNFSNTARCDHHMIQQNLELFIVPQGYSTVGFNKNYSFAC